jgi:hypothetical protein
MSNNQLALFFSTLAEKRKAFAENYAYFAPQLAPRFNSFKFINPGETKLSEILAMLLNPRAEHAQGDLFLKLFFAEMDIDYPNHTSKIEVKCEALTDKIENSQRRIDILVTFDNHFGLAIENKPWADDQYQQLSDYAEQMKRTFGDNWYLVYLKGDGSDPSEDSATPKQIEEWGSKFKQINFDDIVNWLTKCEAQCQAKNVRYFLSDFIGYCKNQFLGGTDMVDASLVKDFVLKNGENLELAFVVGQQMTAIKEGLFKKFLTDLEAEFNAVRPDWEFESPRFGYKDSKWKSIVFRNPEWTKYQIGISFDANECGAFCWGILKRNDKILDLPEGTLQKLNDTFKDTGKKLPWWPWCCYFSAPNDNWSRNPQPWRDIQSGDMAKMVVGKIIELANAAEAIIDEAEK